MLDRIKLLRELHTASHKLFLDLQDEYQSAQHAWDLMCQDPLFLPKVQAHNTLSLATWCGPVDASYAVNSYAGPHHVLAVDGSQIYPDKHQGTSCFLINIGSILLSYGEQQGACKLWSEPFIFADQYDDDQLRSVDMVNGKREEYEFQVGLHYAKDIQKRSKDPVIFLFDGSLVFWHLEGKDLVLKNFFLEKYKQLLEGFCKEQILMAGYLSLPKNKELVLLARAHVTDFALATKEHTELFKHTVDTDIAALFLKPGMRSTLFENHNAISEFFSPDIKPYFFYYHARVEIVRIEVPGYIAQSEEKIALVISLIANQVEKGQGYPVSVAEAHEQAVIKGADREFFYQMVQKIGFERCKRVVPSQKSNKKRRMVV